MKKIGLLAVVIAALALTIGISFANKEEKKEEVKNVEGTLTEIMEKLNKEIPEDNIPMALGDIEITEETIANFVGTEDIEYKEALASESQIGSIAHSVVLIRTKENADIESIKTKIKENVNPRKWICVGVEDDEVIIKNKGDLIVVIIIQDETNRSAIEKAFDAL